MSDLADQNSPIAADISDAPDPGPADDAKSSKAGERERKRRVKNRGRTGIWALFSLAALGVVVLAAALVIQGRPVIAPDWMKSELEERIGKALPGLSVEVGEVSVVFEQEWTPRVRLRDIDVRQSDGASLIQLSDIETTLGLPALMQGQLRPHSIWLTGAQLALRRDADGGFDLAFGDGQLQLGQGGSLAELIEGLDRVFSVPQFSALRMIDVDSVTVRYEDARAQRGWSVDGGRVQLNRTGDDLRLRGDFALLTGGATAAILEMNYESRIGTPAASFGIGFEDMAAADIASQGPSLAWLGILDAPISGALRASVDDSGQIGPLNATLQISAGVLQPTPETKPIPFESARSYFTYTPATQKLRFDEFSLESKWATLSVEGQAFLGGIEAGLPNDMLAHFSITDILINPDNLYSEPVQLEGARMDLRLQLDPFVLDLGELVVQDQGESLKLQGQLRAAPEGWDLSMVGSLRALKRDRLLALWPERAAPRTRDWVVRNLKAADISNVQLGLLSKPLTAPEVYVGFDFSKVESIFLKTMPPVFDAAGHASLSQNRFSISLDQGRVRAAEGGEVDVSGTSFVVPDVRVRQGPGEVRLRARSTITAALTLLDRKPFNFLKKAGQSTTMADGRAEVSGLINIHLKPKLAPEEVQISIDGVLRDVRSETLIEGRVLAAPEIAVHVDNTSLVLKGRGRIGEVPFEGQFASALGPGAGGKSRISGQVELSPRFVDEFDIGLPDNSVSGVGRADVVIELARGQRPKFHMSSRLSGVGMRFAPLGWSLSQKSQGNLTVSGTLGTPPTVDNLELDAPGLYAKGAIAIKSDGSLDAARFSKVRAGDWLNAAVVVEGRGLRAAPAVRVTSGTIDLRKTAIGGPASSGSDAQSGGPLSLSVSLLQISDGISLTNFKGDFTTNGGMDGRFSGLVNGDTAVTGQVIPQGPRSAFRIRSKDAGGVFRSSGLLEQARGGDLSLTLVPSGKEGSYNGTLKVTNVRLVDAPAMAELLNAVSIVGLLEQTAGRGIHFAEVDGRFRLTPTAVYVLKSSAIGASLGVSMDGIYTLGSGEMDMQGVVSPIYMLNAVGAVLTRKGEGLLGFNYKLLGTSDDPKVKVNPLSILTPGTFREIFRRPPPKIDPETGEISLTRPKPTRPQQNSDRDR